MTARQRLRLTLTMAMLVLMYFGMLTILALPARAGVCDGMGALSDACTDCIHETDSHGTGVFRNRCYGDPAYVGPYQTGTP
jgi:hypothetical protein